MKRNFFLTFIFLTFIASVLCAQSDHSNLQLRAEPAYFSPNKDGLQDHVFFYSVLQSNVDILRWRLDIMQSGHRRLVRLSGAGLPALIKWDGLDKKGNRVLDGDYTARLEVTGRSKKISSQTNFFVDTHSPQLSLTLSTGVFDKAFLGSGAIEFFPTISDESPANHWLVQIINSEGRTVQMFWSSGTAHPISWDGTDQSTKVLVPQGNYRCALQAWDKAGNESAPIFTDLVVNVTAREMLEQALHRIQVVETPLGLIVQLNRDDLFLVKGKKVSLTEEGAERLREAAMLINAYPDVSVKLDGYSKVNKIALKDRHFASLYAWKVYSYLIKVGNVKASRLTVRGRGRSAMFDRRAVVVPFIRNGVEIILEGDRAW